MSEPRQQALQLILLQPLSADHTTVAVKIADDRGIESLKIIRLEK